MTEQGIMTLLFSCSVVLLGCARTTIDDNYRMVDVPVATRNDKSLNIVRLRFTMPGRHVEMTYEGVLNPIQIDLSYDSCDESVHILIPVSSDRIVREHFLVALNGDQVDSIGWDSDVDHVGNSDEEYYDFVDEYESEVRFDDNPDEIVVGHSKISPFRWWNFISKEEKRIRIVQYENRKESVTIPGG